jgi:hypothetical protein
MFEKLVVIVVIVVIVVKKDVLLIHHVQSHHRKDLYIIFGYKRLISDVKNELDRQFI